MKKNRMKCWAALASVLVAIGSADAIAANANGLSTINLGTNDVSATGSETFICIREVFVITQAEVNKARADNPGKPDSDIVIIQGSASLMDKDTPNAAADDAYATAPIGINLSGFAESPGTPGFFNSSWEKCVKMHKNVTAGNGAKALDDNDDGDATVEHLELYSKKSWTALPESPPFGMDDPEEHEETQRNNATTLDLKVK